MERVTVPSGTYGNAFKVFYVVDFGATCATDEFGENLGCFRGFTIGEIAYAPDVGPIYSHERERVGAPTVLEPSRLTDRVILHRAAP